MTFEDPVRPYHHRSWRNVLGDHRIRPNRGALANHDRSKNFAASPQIHSISNFRHLLKVKLCTPKSDLMSDDHVRPKTHPPTHYNPVRVGQKSARRQRDPKVRTR